MCLWTSLPVWRSCSCLASLASRCSKHHCPSVQADPACWGKSLPAFQGRDKSHKVSLHFSRSPGQEEGPVNTQKQAGLLRDPGAQWVGSPST